jgi:dsDNA-specific endonuclease/ATPase MutS2
MRDLQNTATLINYHIRIIVGHPYGVYRNIFSKLLQNNRKCKNSRIATASRFCKANHLEIL